MGVIFRNNKWVADCFLGRDHKPQRIRPVFDTQREADLFYAEVRLALQKGLPLPTYKKIKTVYTLEELFRDVHKRFYEHEKKLSSLGKMKIIMDILGANFPVSCIKYKHLEEIREYGIKHRNWSNGTINRYNSLMSKSLGYALKLGIITDKPKLEFEKEGKGRLRYLSEKEQENIIKYLRQICPEFCDFVIFLLDTGLRSRSEALHVSLKDFNEKTNALRVYGSKTDRDRTIYLTDRAAEILKKYNRFIFEEHQIRAWWDRLRNHLGDYDKDFVPHILRHTCCSMLVQRGVPLVTVMKWMGHTSMQTTLRYAHLCDKNLEQAKEVLQAKNIVTLK